MTSRLSVYRADWVLPATAAPVRNGAVLVGTDGRIAAVGPAEAIDAGPNATVIELGAAALMPGLINVHAHPDLAMFRGALEDLAFRDWILRMLGAKRTTLTQEDFEAAARWTMIEAVRAGITTIAATEPSAASLPALRESGLRGIIYHEVFGPDPADANDAVGELRRALDALRVHASDRIAIGVSPHAPFTVSDELYRLTALLAADEGLPMAVHIAESAAERMLVTEGDGDFAPGLRARGISTPVRAASPIRLLEQLGVLDVRPLLIHCVDIDVDDIRLIADAGCAMAHCPIANAKLGHGIAPLATLLDAGVTVGIGTDSVGSNNRLDLIEEARVAALMQRGVNRSPTLLPAGELLRLCTIAGARALGMDDQIGSLEPGKQADLCAVSLAGTHARPVHDPVAAVFHAARGADVVLTVVGGRVLHGPGADRVFDEADIAARVESAAARVAEVSGERGARTSGSRRQRGGEGQRIGKALERG
jgi:5-methylthioadenosine/S-adenosylhomocysteine deaminase